MPLHALQARHISVHHIGAAHSSDLPERDAAPLGVVPDFWTEHGAFVNKWSILFWTTYRRGLTLHSFSKRRTLNTQQQPSVLKLTPNTAKWQNEHNANYLLLSYTCRTLKKIISFNRICAAKRHAVYRDVNGISAKSLQSSPPMIKTDRRTDQRCNIINRSAFRFTINFVCHTTVHSYTNKHL
jgi:hypothetical protein